MLLIQSAHQTSSGLPSGLSSGSSCPWDRGFKEFLILQHSLPTISLLLHLKTFFFRGPSKISGPLEKKYWAKSLLNPAILDWRTLNGGFVDRVVVCNRDLLCWVVDCCQLSAVSCSPLCLSGHLGSRSQKWDYSKNYSNIIAINCNYNCN